MLFVSPCVVFMTHYIVHAAMHQLSCWLSWLAVRVCFSGRHMAGSCLTCCLNEGEQYGWWYDWTGLGEWLRVSWDFGCEGLWVRKRDRKSDCAVAVTRSPSTPSMRFPSSICPLLSPSRLYRRESAPGPHPRVHNVPKRDYHLVMAGVHRR